MVAQEQDRQIQKSIAKSISLESTPSIMKLNEAILEEFGYLPDFDLIDYFIEAIKENTKNQKYGRLDPKLQLAYAVANGQDPNVPKFFELYQNNFDELPANDVLKYFLATVRSRQKTNNKKRDPGFSLAQKVASNNSPSFSKLCQEFEKKSEPPPSFEIIDFFISQILRTPKSSI